MNIKTKFNIGDVVDYAYNGAILTGTITDIKVDVMTSYIPEYIKKGEPLIQYCIDSILWIMELVDFPRNPIAKVIKED